MWNSLIQVIKIVWKTIDRAIHSRRSAPFVRFMILACFTVATFYMLRGV
jgi:hypothetical protein